ncbi:MAG: class II aldolase/adducin family protein [Myxococcales bacterium]
MDCLSCTTEAERRAQVIRFCGLLHDKGFLAANDGNVSVRLCRDRLLVTPSGTAKAFLTPEDLLVVDGEGRLLEGAGKPTSELAMHLEVLRRRPDVQAVVHAHPPTCIALTLVRHPRLDDVLPEVILGLGRIEVVPYARPQSEALARALSDRIAASDAVILERHGTLTVGRSVAEAYFLTERLEHAAHVLWLAHALGRPAALPEHEARELRRTHDRERRDPRTA